MRRLTPELDDARSSDDVESPSVREKISALLQELQPYENLDLIREMLVTAANLVNDGASRGDVKILRTASKELRHAFRVLAQYKDVPKVAVFGSARTDPEHPCYKTARQFARRISERGYMIVTGAGGGIMAAGNEGAGKDNSFGLNISLPFEQRANEWVDESDKLINFNYFFTRKLFFIKEADAIVLLPGGFGTMDEGFEALTLIQTGKDDPTPVVFLDRPGGTYWKNWFQFIRENLLAEGLVSFEDRSLFLITDDVEEACTEIVQFYRRYHSCRFVNKKTQLVIRLKDEISSDGIVRLNRQFKDLLAGGEIESCTAFEEELNEPDTLHLPRLVLHFNQRHYSRLRELIDAVNRIS